MTDSEDSDYNVEEYVIPDTIRRTYNNKDLLSDEEQETGSSESEQEGNEEPEQDVTNSYCKLANGNGEISSSNQEEVVDEPVRPNSRYILYVTNLTSETTKSMLEDFFSDAGEVKAIRIPKVRLGSFAFVEMKEFEGFKKGLKFNNKELDGRKIQVYEGSKNKKHTSSKTKNLKRKTQQQHISNIKIKNKRIE